MMSHYAIIEAGGEGGDFNFQGEDSEIGNQSRQEHRENIEIPQGYNDQGPQVPREQAPPSPPVAVPGLHQNT